MMMTPSPRRPRSTRQALAGLDLALCAVARPNPVVLAWRWRYELGLVTGLPIAMIVLASAVGIGWAVTGAAALVSLMICAPRVRWLVVARAWCIITPHRVRTGCAQAWIHSRTGKIPIVLLTTRESFGERVHLWCRAGTGAADLAWARDLLAVACWAQDVQVFRHERFAQLVTLDVIRRPQLGTLGDPEHDDWPRMTTPLAGTPPTTGASPSPLTTDLTPDGDEPGHTA
jgi:hypothetical protein